MGFSPETQIGTLIDFSRGGGWGKEAPFEGSTRVAVVRGADFPDVEAGRYTSLPFRYEKEAKARNVALRTGDIVLENSGGTDTRPTGRTVLISQELLDVYDCPVIPASFCRIVRFNASVDSEFIYYWLQNMFNAGRTWGYQNRSTGLSNFQFRTFAEMELVPDLSLETQRQIGRILAMLDKKRLNNNRLNGYLEELLLARYDESFGLFDSSTCNGKLADIGEVVGGATPSKKRPDYYSRDGIGWVTPRDLSNTNNKFIAHGADGITQAGYDSCSARLLRKGSVLFSSRAPIGYIAIADDELATNQGFKSVIPNPEVGTAFVYCFLKRNSRRIADMGAGTTFPEVSGKMMKAVELKLPEPETCRLFSTFAKPLLRMQRKCEVENVALESLRDTLLPKLMSGEIDVSKVNLTQLNSHLA